jgi:hypothetical protein
VRIAVLAIGAVAAGALAILVLVIPISPVCLPASGLAAMLQVGPDIDNRYWHIDQRFTLEDAAAGVNPNANPSSGHAHG